MKLPKKIDSWEKILARFIVASGLPYFFWDGASKRFKGIYGWTFARVSPRNHGGWDRVPEAFRFLEKRSDMPMIVFLASKDNGETIDDSYVLMRLSTFAPFLVNKVESDPERHIRKEK
jgi:hypothetical protein